MKIIIKNKLEYALPTETTINGLTMEITKKLAHWADQLEQASRMLDQCILCQQSTHSYHQVCNHCADLLPMFKFELVDNDLLNWPAIHQLFKQRKFDHLLSLAPYEWPFDYWIKQLKYQKQYQYARLFADLLHEQFNKLRQQETYHQISCVLPVPAHLNKWQQRGFNQSYLLAKYFCRQNQLPLLDSCLIRTAHKSSQASQTGAKRRKAIKGNFTLTDINIVKGQHILLIDDVITTGATVNEVSQLLKAAGALSVTVLTACIALPE